MQIVIPMSGFGERFKKAGYEVPKPLIQVDGKPIIQHVVEMFPGSSDFIFIVNREHLEVEKYNLESTLKRIAPAGRIVAIEPHKLGPIHAVLNAIEQIDLAKPTVVNYCDFTCLWDWQNFKKFVSENDLAGCLPAYKGFHPHSLGTTNYAYIREEDGRFVDIQEKQPFTSNRMNEYASSGTYYFASGALMKKAFEFVVSNELNVNGEYYVSMAYKYLAKNNLEAFVYPLQHFMQWGTPEDLNEYQDWSDIFKSAILNENRQSGSCETLLVPMAGLGNRFKIEGYSITKPLIEVSGRPMVIQASLCLPKAKENIFVLRTDMDGFEHVEVEISSAIPKSKFVEISEVTDGQARTVDLGLKISKYSGPVVVGTCDSGAIYDGAKHDELIAEDNFDLLIWSARGHANAIRQPEIFGWVIEREGEVKGVSVKTPISDPKVDPIVIGTMTVRNTQILTKCLESLFKRQAMINGEFYLDSIIDDALELGFKVGLFEVDAYISWGTPNDLKTFKYWQSCFHQWENHPYSVAADSWISDTERVLNQIKINRFFPRIENGQLVIE